MATTNFRNVCADKYYVLNDPEEDSYLDDIMYDIACPLEDEGFCLGRKWDGNNHVVAERLTGSERKPLYADITTQFMVNPGYYADATLDYDVKVSLNCGEEFCLSDHEGCVEELVDELIEEARLILKEDIGWSLYGIGKREAGFRDWLREAVMREKSLMEDYCSKCCDEILVMVGRFSDGSAVYQRG